MIKLRIFAAIIYALAAACIASSVSGQIPAASAKYKATVIRESHARGGLQAPTAMFAGQLMQESGWNPNAHSGVGAQGLAQFMPQSALWLSKTYPADLPGAASLDPAWSIRALIFYDYWLAQRLPQFTAVDENRFAAALSGYNGGLGYLYRDLKLMKCATSCLWWSGAELVDDGRTAANLKQNRDYPFKIIKLYEPKYKIAGWN